MSTAVRTSHRGRGEDSYPTVSSVWTDVSHLSRTLLRPRTLTVVVAGGILFGSLLPLSGTLSPLPSPPSVPTTPGLFGLGFDKPVHALSYALLGGLAAAWRGEVGLALVGVVVAVAGFGAGVEVAQLAVPGRTASMGDTAANFVGAVAGAASWRLWCRLRRRPAGESVN